MDVVLPEFAVVDDSSLVRRAWGRKNKEKCVIRCFESPESFWSDVEQTPERLQKYSFVVTDFLFDDESDFNGFEFAVELRKKFSGPILLSTSGELTLPEQNCPIDFMMEKDVFTYAELLEKISANLKR